MSKYLHRFPPEYQNKVGIHSRKELHDNSKELIDVVLENNIDLNGAVIFEFGSGGGRNLKYFNEQNHSIVLYANDLHQEAVLKNMFPSIKDKVIFFELDTLTLVKNNFPPKPITILLSSDHFMHVDDKTFMEICLYVKTKWKPMYILLRESRIAREGGGKHQIEKHEYDDNFVSHYELIHKRISSTDGNYFVRLYYLLNP